MVSGLGRSNRSKRRSFRNTTVPTPSSRAIGAIESGSATPFWIRRSRASTRRAEAGDPWGRISRAR